MADIEIRFNPSLVGTVPDGYITEAKLAADAVTVTKIKDAAVESAKIKDANVVEAKLATDAVTKDKIKDGEVLEVKIVSKTFVLAHKGSAISKVLQTGYDAATGELVLLVSETPNE